VKPLLLDQNIVVELTTNLQLGEKKKKCKSSPNTNRWTTSTL